MADYTETFTSTTGDTIDASELETQFDDIATAIATKLDSDGSGSMSGDLAMGSNNITGLADPTAAQHAATKAYVDSSFITGGVIPYAGATAPTGFLVCDGSAVSRATYADLFAVISTTYGSGDGSTTFNLPDLRGRVVAGKGSGTRLTTKLTDATLGDTGGSQGLNHTHSVSGTTGGFPTSTAAAAGGAEFVVDNSNHTHSFSATSGNPSDNSLVQPTIILNYLIKT